MKTALSLLAAAAFNAASLSATVVSVDFNDLALGELRPGQKNNQPANTGQGFAATHWATDTGIPRIVNGDLTAPAATNYAIAQKPPARSYQALSYNIDNDTDRRMGRAIAEPLTGTVWITFLVKNAEEKQAAGIDLNVRPALYNVPCPTRIVVEGSTVRVFNAGGVKAGEIANIAPLGQTALVLVRLDMGGGSNPANDRMQIWVNPTLTADPDALGKPHAVLPNTGFIGANKSVHTLGLQSYNLATGAGQIGGVLDAVRLASGPEAYSAVAGVRM